MSEGYKGGITAYVTKYVCSKGILKIVGETNQTYFRSSKDHVYVRVGKDAFFTEVEARADAKAKIQSRVNTLKKSLSKLEKLDTSTMKIVELSWGTYEHPNRRNAGCEEGHRGRDRPGPVAGRPLVRP